LKPASSREDIVRMFDRISPVYDLMNRLMSLGMDRAWRRKAISVLEITPGAHVLDLACGTCDMTLEAFKYQQDIQVIGVDPSSAMMNVSRRRIPKDTALLVQTWSEQLPFMQNSFDRAMMAFGIRSFPDRVHSLKELQRVVISGGRLVILEMTSRKHSIMNTLFGWYFRVLVPIVGTIISREKSAYHFLPASVDAFPQPIDFAGEIITAGWNSVHWFSLTGGVVTLFVADK
jgi:demethylmenaquinone methyltransferase/2-methoxy-6-polyprenyl-1,4-benzoquinol methylase